MYKGIADISDESWEKWIIDSGKISELLQQKFSYYGVSSNDGIADKCRPIGGLKRKITNVKNKGNKLISIFFYSVPENFLTIMFDSIVELGRCEEYIYLTINDEYFKFDFDEQQVLEILSNNINVKSGEIFIVGRLELPYYHIIGKDEKCKSLKIIETLA